MNNKEITTINEDAIRRHFDEESGEFYFSIVDVIDSLGLSKDSRNYWKVLKNRLKNGQNKLVTECNQLKMKANDGKSYLTDVAKSSTILQIIEIISPEKVAMFEEFFNNIENKKEDTHINFFSGGEKEKNLSTVEEDDKKIKLDMYQKNNFIFVKTSIEGVDPENIFISLNSQMLTLKFSRLPQRKNHEESDSYSVDEIPWGRFSRSIYLPCEVDIDRVETNFYHGLLLLKFFILDKTRTKIIKVK